MLGLRTVVSEREQVHLGHDDTMAVSRRSPALERIAHRGGNHCARIVGLAADDVEMIAVVAQDIAHDREQQWSLDTK